MFHPNLRSTSLHNPPPTPKVEKMLSLNLGAGGSTTIPAVAKVNRAKPLKVPSKWMLAEG